ncbi:MAG: amidase family protein, partial [Nocardioidaceae bacterium]
ALCGAAVGVKDIMRVEGLPTHAGSQVPPAALAGPEATLVGRLRDAGALVAGTTVTAEFASAAPGETRNPHDFAHTPGGSSSGSAAAVAAGMVPLATGTQTIGSVIRPAGFCGIVGFKATHGRVPVDGVIAHSPSLDTIGLFAADVAGLALAAPVVWDGWQPVSAANAGADSGADPGLAADTAGPVLGVPTGGYLEQADALATAAFADHCAALAEAGYEMRRVGVLDDLDEITRHDRIVNRYELARTHQTWFAQYADRYRHETSAAILEGQAVTPTEYDDAQRHLTWLRQDMTRRFHAAGVDLVVAPSAPGPAPAGLATTGDPVMNRPWTYAGLPALGLPAGVTPDGLPLGLQCLAPAGRDEQLLAWGEGLHDAVRR